MLPFSLQGWGTQSTLTPALAPVEQPGLCFSEAGHWWKQELPLDLQPPLPRQPAFSPQPPFPGNVQTLGVEFLACTSALPIAD